MSGRRWAKWGGPIPDQNRHLRPSERRGSGQRDSPLRQRQREEQAARELDPRTMERMRARLEPPRAPWHPLPLAELAIAIGVVFAIAGAVISNERAIGGGFLLVLVGTAEFSWREHRHGYRSHSTVLAGVVGMIVAMGLWAGTGAHRNLAIGVGLAVFLAVWGLLARSFTPDPRLQR